MGRSQHVPETSLSVCSSELEPRPPKKAKKKKTRREGGEGCVETRALPCCLFQVRKRVTVHTSGNGARAPFFTQRPPPRSSFLRARLLEPKETHETFYVSEVFPQHLALFGSPAPVAVSVIPHRYYGVFRAHAPRCTLRDGSFLSRVPSPFVRLARKKGRPRAFNVGDWGARGRARASGPALRTRAVVIGAADLTGWAGGGCWLGLVLVGRGRRRRRGEREKGEQGGSGSHSRE